MIRHLLNVVRAHLHEYSKAHARSPKWRTEERKHLAANPSCAACGSFKRVQVHHVLPFAQHPELELVSSNLLSLCMDVRECHLAIGHGGSFRAWNPQVREHARALLASRGERFETVARWAKQARRCMSEVA